MPQLNFHAPIPVNIITGALGAGKTTAIARLLAGKPASEFWLVILNEITDTGIDALTLSVAAMGAYDVRTIPGGCLCCTGEEDFRRQLSGLLALPPEQWPARILIEPSGIGHPGGLIDTLRGFERGGAIRLLSTIVLLEGQCNTDWSMLNAVTRAQVDAADVVMLSKAELLQAATRAAFLQWAQELFPTKRFIGCSERGVLPELALSPPLTTFSFELPARPLLHRQARASGLLDHVGQHEHAPQINERQLHLNNAIAQVKWQRLLECEACGWTMPASLLFDLPKLQMLLADEGNAWQGVVRFKAVLRTDVDRWHLLQRWGQQHAIVDCNWCQDSRIEMQLAEGATVDWPAWDQRWLLLSAACPVG